MFYKIKYIYFLISKNNLNLKVFILITIIIYWTEIKKIILTYI